MLLNNNGSQTSSTTTRNANNWGDEHKAATEKLGTETTTTTFDDKREHLFLRKQHNCFLHCDFPSECHHTLFRAQQEGRPILREALALDAAREAVAGANQLELELGTTTKKFGRRRPTAQNGRTAAPSTRLPYSSLETPPLPAVDKADEEGEDNVSPCSPTSPDPPGDLMREVQQVSPIERDDENNHPPVSPGGTRRRSLLVPTDTPADFATTAGALCFDDEDTYSDDDDEEECGDGDDDEGGEKRARQAKRSCRKIAQLTGEEEFGPFVFDTSSPTSPSPSSGITTTTTSDIVQNIQKAALDLQAAYSESAWFAPSTVTTTISADPTSSLSPRSPERVGKRDRMLALLGRRAVGGGGSPSSSSSRGVDVDVHIDNVSASRENQQVTGEEWDNWSDDSSSSSSASTTSAPDTDADGDVTMRDAGAASLPPAEDDDESPATPPRRQRSGGDGTDADLRALLRMRNAFMRGDMI